MAPGSSRTIELLPTNLARIFSLAHPILLLSAYYAQFPHIVSNPIQHLLNFLFPLTAIQIAYVATCLPCAGSPSPMARSKKIPVKQSTARTSTVFLSLILTVLSVPLITILQILFGAPFENYEYLLKTVLSSTHLSLLGIFPLIYVHGSDSEKWQEVVSVYCPFDEVFGASVGAFIGAWLGAIPIPLDWDRDWQEWPITVVTGIYLGFFAGKFMGRWVFNGKRIELK